MRSFALAAALVTTAAGHGAMVIPRSRNAIDGTDAPWSKAVPWPVPSRTARSGVRSPTARTRRS